MTTSNLGLVIRRAHGSDYGAGCRLLDQLDSQHLDRLPWLFKAPESQPRSAEFFEGLVAGSESVVLVAEAADDGVVGVIIGLTRAAAVFPIFIQQRFGVLDSLVVDPAWRRRGVGRLLVQALEAWAVEQRVPWVELSVYDFNSEARGFYESLGYLPLRTVLRKSAL